MGDRYEVPEDRYCYPGTTVLRNTLDIRDPAKLEAFEMEMASLRAEEDLPPGDFDPAHYRAVHRHLFGDVYGWADRYRHVGTGKGGNLFCVPERIEPEMRKLFAKLESPDFLPGSEQTAFIDAVADFLGELNAIHPFREGNGRAQFVFVRLLGQRAGYPFRLEIPEPEAFMAAMIASFQCDLEPLIDELERLQA